MLQSIGINNYRQIQLSFPVAICCNCLFLFFSAVIGCNYKYSRQQCCNYKYSSIVFSCNYKYSSILFLLFFLVFANSVCCICLYLFVFYCNYFDILDRSATGIVCICLYLSVFVCVFKIITVVIISCVQDQQNYQFFTFFLEKYHQS